MEQNRNLADIAQDIKIDWKSPYYGAVPYVEAMACMTSVTSHYGSDSGESVVRGFLVNSQSWRGETARRVKDELRRMVGV